MRSPRFFITPDQVAGHRISVLGEDVRHIALVLRMKAGDELLLCDGQGTGYRAKIVELSRAEIRTEVVSQAKQEITEPRITLCQGLPKSDKMDLIVQKATELGAAAVVPLVTERTIVKVRDGEKRITRWQKIAREAAMQSNRPDIPLIHTIISLQNFLQTPNSEPQTLLLLPWEEGIEPLKEALRRNVAVKKIFVLIGPEGGFSSSEASSARERGFNLVSLGPNILRTETAAIAALSMIGYEYWQPGDEKNLSDH
jgi:16S rRNA (uracil1498-N3)-methyltransferase